MCKKIPSGHKAASAAPKDVAHDRLVESDEQGMCTKIANPGYIAEATMLLREVRWSVSLRRSVATMEKKHWEGWLMYGPWRDHWLAQWLPRSA